MKLIKSKLVVALALAAISFGALSFTTTPVYAKETVSTVSYSPLLFQDLPAAALRDADAAAQAAALARAAAAAVDFATRVAAGLVVGLVFRAFGYEEYEQYPQNALDQ